MLVATHRNNSEVAPKLLAQKNTACRRRNWENDGTRINKGGAIFDPLHYLAQETWLGTSDYRSAGPSELQTQPVRPSIQVYSLSSFERLQRCMQHATHGVQQTFSSGFLNTVDLSKPLDVVRDSCSAVFSMIIELRILKCGLFPGKQ